jgi:hypothetical protein
MTETALRTGIGATSSRNVDPAARGWYPVPGRRGSAAAICPACRSVHGQSARLRAERAHRFMA